MNNRKFFHTGVRRTVARALFGLASLVLLSQAAQAADWNGIEPLKSRRADVERILGKPVTDLAGKTGTLHFKVQGGTVTVAFVNAHFVATKKLDPSLEGTVLQIVLQHDNSSDTPESLGLPSKSKFERENTPVGAIFRNQKEGIVYTFVGGRLKTTRYTPSASELGRARKG